MLLLQGEIVLVRNLETVRQAHFELLREEVARFAAVPRNRSGVIEIHEKRVWRQNVDLRVG